MVAPGQEVVDGDTVFRTREANAIDVSVVRRFGGRDATGAATLHGMSLDDARRSPLVRVAVGRAWLALHGALASEPNVAYDCAGRALDEVGTDYPKRRDGRNLVDDTGHAIRIARSMAERGDVAGASAELGEVLKSRVELYIRASDGKVE